MRSKSFIFTTVALLGYYGCAGVGKIGSSVSRLTYISPARVEQSIRETAAVEMWSQDKLATHLNWIPEGGTIEIKINSFTIEHANTENYSVIVQHKGEEVFRETGKFTEIAIRKPPASAAGMNDGQAQRA